MPLSKARMRERKRQDRQNELKYRKYRNVLAVKPIVKPTTPVKPSIAELQAMIHRIENQELPDAVFLPFTKRERHFLVDVPWYNKKIHKSGDVVRVERDGKITVEVVPELDAEGNIIM